MSYSFEMSPLKCEIRYFVKYLVISQNNDMFVIKVQ